MLPKIKQIDVDQFVPQKDNYELVFQDNTPLSIVLTSINAQEDNKKFYIIQVLKDKIAAANNYFIYCRWGRIGAEGQKMLKECQNHLEEAVKQYQKKIDDKTQAGYQQIDTP